jgi:YbbR domain-containing protein
MSKETLRALGANLRTLLWALILALAVWVAAVTAADPDEERFLSAPIPVEVVGQDSSLIISGEYPKQVEVSLHAPLSVWERIEADPAGVRVILDLSGLSNGEHSVDLQVQVNERPVKIVSVTPASATLLLEPVATRSVAVDLSLVGQPATGYQAGDPSLDPLQVVVAGPKSLVDTVTRARAALNLDGLREAVDRALPVDLLDENGQVVRGLSVSPQEVQIQLDITQQGGYRDLAVKVTVQGQVASGYRLTDISVFPPVVTVYSSDPNVVLELPGVVETQPLDLQNASEDISTRLDLNLPQGVSVVGEQTVMILAGISPIESSLTLSNELVQMVGLPPGLTAQVLPPTVDVIVSGPLPLLDTLTRQDIRVTVDLGGLEAGTHQLTPKVEILIADVIVESILPGTVEVTLSLAQTPNPNLPTPTPTPTPLSVLPRWEAHPLPGGFPLPCCAPPRREELIVDPMERFD